jgi:NAD(P)H-hydrate epimerase
MMLPPGMVALTTAQMIEVDRAMVDDLHIGLIQMMENAGRHLADLARSRFLDGDPRGREVVVLAGTGANVRVVVTASDQKFTPVPAHQLDIVNRMGIPVARHHALAGMTADLILDGVIGYSINGAPRGEAAELIRWSRDQMAPVLSLDVPSGFEPDSGVSHDPAVRATATLTLALPKVGLLAPEAADQVGELYLADIGVPASLYAGPGLNLAIEPIFARSEIIRIA